MYLRLLSEAGAPTFCVDVDDVAAIATGGRIVRYKLSQCWDADLIGATSQKTGGVHRLRTKPPSGAAMCRCAR